MSVLIKGAEMPKSCDNCWFEYAYEICTPETGYENCPLIKLSPHGRCIDADALKVDHGWLDNQDGTKTHIQFVYANSIINAPTIIEAERTE